MKPLLRIVASLSIASLAACSFSSAATDYQAGTVPIANSATWTATPSATHSPTTTATATAIPTATPTNTASPTPIGGTGKILFNYYRQNGFEAAFDLNGELNVFHSNWDGSDLMPLTDGLNGYNYIQSISPDGHQALIASFSQQAFLFNTFGDLYVVELGRQSPQPRKIASGVYIAFGGTVALWINERQIVFIARDQGDYGVYTANSDGSGSKRISTPEQTGRPLHLLSVTKDGRVYWQGGLQYGSNGIQQNGVWWSSLNGSEQSRLILEKQNSGIHGAAASARISPDGQYIAWQEVVGTISVAPLIAVENAKNLSPPIGNDYAVHWLPDSTQVLVTATFFQPYAFYLLNVADFSLTQIAVPFAENVGYEPISLSPDGRQLLLLTYTYNQQTGQRGRATIMLDLERLSIKDEFTRQINPQVALIEPTWGGILWIPN